MMQMAAIAAWVSLSHLSAYAWTVVLSPAAKPLRATNVTCVDSPVGPAIEVPTNGFYEVAVPDGAIGTDEGTVSVWFRQNWTPWGGMTFRDRDKDVDGNWPTFLHCGYWTRNLANTGDLRHARRHQPGGTRLPRVRREPDGLRLHLPRPHPRTRARLPRRDRVSGRCAARVFSRRVLRRLQPLLRRNDRLRGHPDGSGLRFCVDVFDPEFIPPTVEGHMYRDDSIQIYFDQRNNARFGVGSGYDEDDVVFQIGLMNGKTPRHYREYPKNEPILDAKVNVWRKDDHTYYDVFIPKSELPFADLSAGRVIGFGILVNQKMRDAAGEYSACIGSPSPYLNPCNWYDAYLK